MSLHLIQPRELFGPSARQEELKTCWRINDELFDEVTTPVGRPTFAELFSLCKPDRINVIANSDIYFDATIHLANPSPSQVYALSRWDVLDDGASVLWDHPDSQDVWIVNGGPHSVPARFLMGVAGCDNALAFILQSEGYIVINPSKTIKAHHLHLVQWRSYLMDPTGKARGGDKIERVSPPYAMIKPTTL